MKHLIIAVLAAITLSGCCKSKIVEVPVIVPPPEIHVPAEPAYPVITLRASPKETMGFCAEKLTLQEGHIKELRRLLDREKEKGETR